MSAIFFDRYFEGNPLTSTNFESGDEAIARLQGELNRVPHFVELQSDKNTKLLIGLGGEMGCAQFSSIAGDPPYLMACLPGHESLEGFEYFYISGELSEVPKQYCIPLGALLKVIKDFVDTGTQSHTVNWVEI